MRLHYLLKNREYKTSKYTTFKIFEGKERVISRLPYWPDRITHHAIMNLLEPLFVSTFISQTYSCIKERGILAATMAVREALTDEAATKYCLKLDIKKFYHNINHEVLKRLLRRKIKDNDLLWLLDEITDSAPGVPIGNYLSQYLANFYLSYFDHWLKEVKGVKYYYRYADDMVVLAGSKEYLHQLLAEMRDYLSSELKLTIKENYQIFPVEARGIDFVGYVKRHNYVLVRPLIKQNCARMIAHNKNVASLASYNGWFKWADCKHLVKKLAA